MSGDIVIPITWCTDNYLGKRYANWQGVGICRLCNKRIEIKVEKEKRTLCSEFKKDNNSIWLKGENNELVQGRRIEDEERERKALHGKSKTPNP